MLLALDTATATASIAIYDLAEQQLLAELTWQARRRQTQDLLTIAQQWLAQLDLTAQDLTALAVTTGPGSFTGVRIAISAVKGIGLGLSTAPQVIGLPTLCVTAAPWLLLAQRAKPTPTLCAFIQAGRGRYNWTFFAAGDLLHHPTAADHSGGTADEFAQALAALAPQSIWLTGELDAPLEKAMQSLTHVFVLDRVSSTRRAGQLARLAAFHLAYGNRDDLQTLQPLYLRNP
ncbi:MAG: tRNA (adenosine(37)-N6)-threonylcarbamoyltransferase complex dimerization subunit type 1 TsaB [Caldilineaceae bacterium]